MKVPEEDEQGLTIPAVRAPMALFRQNLQERNPNQGQNQERQEMRNRRRKTQQSISKQEKISLHQCRQDQDVAQYPKNHNEVTQKMMRKVFSTHPLE